MEDWEKKTKIPINWIKINFLNFKLEYNDTYSIILPHLTQYKNVVNFLNI